MSFKEQTMEFLQHYDPLLKSLWYIALPVSLIFIVQSIMTFMGSDAHTGDHADFDGNLDGHASPFQLFSLRNLINFLLGFSWGGISFYTTIPNKPMLIVIAALIGAAFVGLFFMMMRQIQRFAEDNSFRIAEAVNKTCSVYLNIPGHKSGKGKVQVSVRGSLRELDAITGGDRIETGAMVRIIGNEGNELVIVEKI